MPGWTPTVVAEAVAPDLFLQVRQPVPPMTPLGVAATVQLPAVSPLTPLQVT